jgi:hypothetical protein
VSRWIEWDPVLVAMIPVMPKVNDGWRLRKDPMVQISVFTARVDRYLIWSGRRTRVGIED